MYAEETAQKEHFSQNFRYLLFERHPSGFYLVQTHK